MSFVPLVILLSVVGILLSMGTQIFWASAGRMMLAIGAVASICGYCALYVGNLGWPALSAYLFAALIGAVLSFCLAGIGTRLSDDQFLLLAITVSELVRRLAYVANPLTGGAYGLRMTGPWRLRGDVFGYSTGILLLISAVALHFAARTTFGLRWQMIGSAREAGINMGVNPTKIVLQAGAVIGILAGLAGALYVDGVRYLHPEDLGLDISLPALAAGIAARPRALALDLPVLGIILFSLREVLRLLDFSGVARFAADDILIGFILVFGAVRLLRWQENTWAWTK